MMTMQQRLLNWLIDRLHGHGYSQSPEYQLGRLAAREVTAINRHFAQLGVRADIDPSTVIASDTGNFIRYQVRTLGKIRSITTVEQDLSVLLSAMRRDDVTVNIRLPSLTIELPYPFEVKTLEWADAHLGGLRPHQMLLGMDYSKREPAPALVDFTKKNIAHLLLFGTTGSGKTTMLAAMLLSLCRSTGCEEMQVIFLDPKFDEDWSALAGLPHVSLYSDTEDCIKTIRAAHAELNRRRKTPDSRKVYLVIDEFADLITGITDKALQDEVQTMITRIAQIGRSKNIHLILCTQKPTVDIVDTVAKGNFSSRLGGQVTTPEESRVGMGRGDIGCENLPGKGAFYVILAGGPVQRIQGYFLDAETLQNEIDLITVRSQWQTPYTIELDPPTDHAEPAAPTLSEAQAMAQKILAKYKYADLYREDGKIHQGMQLKAIQVNFPNTLANEGEPRRKTLEALREIKLMQKTTPVPSEPSDAPTEPSNSGS